MATTLGTVCALDDCNELVFGRGWCQKHYSRWKRNGDPLHIARTLGCRCNACATCRSRLAAKHRYQPKPCRGCGGIKPSGRSFYCDSCAAEATLRRHANKPLWQREGELRRRYGIGVADYASLLDAQDGVCAICGQPPTKSYLALDIDHCHKTGKVRGLLCRRCNVRLSYIESGLLDESLAYPERGNVLSPQI